MTRALDRYTQQVALKEQIRQGKPTLGLFIKTPSPQIVELLATANFDCVVFDAEHAPFSVEALDRCILAAHAVDIPALVRVAGLSHIQCALDLGAAGVIIPHIRSEKEALDAVAATRYRDGSRGFAASHRAAAYGAIPAAKYRELSDSATIVIGQVEDRSAVDNIDEIAAVSAVDALFIGCADLSVSFGVDDMADPVIDQAVEKICAGGRTTNRTTGIFLPSPSDIKKFQAKGVSLFFISSDQALLTKAACALSEEFSEITSG